MWQPAYLKKCMVSNLVVELILCLTFANINELRERGSLIEETLNLSHFFTLTALNFINIKIILSEDHSSNLNPNLIKNSGKAF